MDSCQNELCSVAASLARLRDRRPGDGANAKGLNYMTQGEITAFLVIYANG